MTWEKMYDPMRRHVEAREALTGASERAPCPGVGRRVPYYDVKGLRAACPVCGHDGAVLDDRDGSVFTYATSHYAKEQGR